MTLDDTQISALISNLNPGRVKHRSQGGAKLSYVEAWEIKTALIRMFGFGGFSAEVIDSGIVTIREGEKKMDGKPKTPQAVCQSTVRLTVYGIGPDGRDAVYTETAIGSNSGWDIGDILDNAQKSASSDALKRAATYLGTQFGLSLYSNGETNDVVRTVLEPTQAEAVNRIRKEREAKYAEEKQAVQDKLANATGSDKDAQ